VTRPGSHGRVRLKYRAHIEMGQSPPSAEYSHLPDEGLPFLQGTADFGPLSPVPRVYCASPTKVATSGDVLFSVRAPVGELNVADQEAGIGRGLCAIRAGALWFPRFGWWALHEARHQLNYVSTGSTYEAVATEDVANLLVEHAALDEQRDIADYLDRETARLDALVAAKERVLGLLTEKRLALITRAVTRGLDPRVTLRDSGILWLGEIPAHWNVMKLKHIASLNSGEFITADSIDSDGDFPVFGGNGMRGYTSSFTHDGDYVLIGRQGALCGNINYATGRFWASEHAVVVSLRKGYQVRWLGELLEVLNLNRLSQSAAQPGLAVEVIANLAVPIPPYSEQRAIADGITSETAKIDALRSETGRTIALLKERRAALIAAAVTGQLEVA
jgi:restriction endonuclease S subunit